MIYGEEPLPCHLLPQENSTEFTEHPKASLLNIYDMNLWEAGCNKHQPGSGRDNSKAGFKQVSHFCCHQGHLQMSQGCAIFIISDPYHFRGPVLFGCPILETPSCVVENFPSYEPLWAKQGLGEDFPRPLKLRHKNDVGFVCQQQ